MRILHIIERLSVADGGPPNGLVTLARGQAEQGHEVTILPCTTAGGPMLLTPGQYGRLMVCSPPMKRKVLWPSRFLQNIVNNLVAGSDIVHIHGTWRYHFIAAAKASIRFSVPYIIRPAGILGRIPRKSKFYLKMPYFYLCEKRYFNRASAVHCTTRKEQHEMNDIRIKADKFVVPQPVSCEIATEPADPNVLEGLCPGLPESAPLLLYLGRLFWIKNLNALAGAFADLAPQFPEARLVFAGPEEGMQVVKELKEIISAAKLQDKVYFTGLVRGPQKQALLRRATIFVQPSLHENFGISLAEALTYGKASVVSSGIGLSDDIQEAEAGIVFDGSARELSLAIKKVLTEPHCRQKLEINAIELSKKFQLKEVVRCLDQQYEKCIATIRMPFKPGEIHE